MLSLSALLVLLSLLHGSQGDTTLCYSCNDVFQPALCMQTTVCAPDQACYVERGLASNGAIKYFSGCLAQKDCPIEHGTHFSVEQCLRCCLGDLCNVRGCGSLAIMAANQLACLSCSDVSSPDVCQSTTVCPAEQLCGAREKVTNGATTYDLGCFDSLACQDTDTSCCSSNGCNHNITAGASSQSPSPTMIPTSTASPQTSDDSTGLSTLDTTERDSTLGSTERDTTVPSTTLGDTTIQLRDTTVVDTTLRDTTTLDITVRDTTVMDTTLRDTTVMDTTVRDTTVMDTTLRDTTVMDTTLRDTTVMDTTLRDTTVVDTTLRDTTAADTTLRDTTVVDTTLRDTTVEATTLRDTTVPSTTIFDTATEETTEGPSTLGDSTLYSTGVTSTLLPSTVMATTEPLTTDDDTTVESTPVPPTNAPSPIPSIDPPTILGQNETTVTKREGSDLLLTCNAAGDTPMTYRWLQPGNGRGDVRLNGTLLVIRNLQANQSGEYVCQATNQHGTAKKIVHVIIQDPSSRVVSSIPGDPWVNPQARQVMFIAQCDVQGQPAPEVTWYKFDQPNSGSSRFSTQNRVLVFPELEPTLDAGLYVCNASNGVEEDLSYLAVYREVSVDCEMNFDQFRSLEVYRATCPPECITLTPLPSPSSVTESSLVCASLVADSSGRVAWLSRASGQIVQLTTDTDGDISIRFL